MSITVATVNTSIGGDTFGSLIIKLNQIIGIVGSNTLTVDATSNGSLTVGNAYLQGYLTVDNVIINQNVSSNNLIISKTLVVGSNTTLSANVLIANNILITGNNIYAGNTIAVFNNVTSNTANINNLTLGNLVVTTTTTNTSTVNNFTTLSSANLNGNTTIANLVTGSVIVNTTINAISLALTSFATITGNTLTGNLVVSNTATINNISVTNNLTANVLTINGNVNTAANVSIGNILTVRGPTIYVGNSTNGNTVASAFQLNGANGSFFLLNNLNQNDPWLYLLTKNSNGVTTSLRPFLVNYNTGGVIIDGNGGSGVTLSLNTFVNNNIFSSSANVYFGGQSFVVNSSSVSFNGGVALNGGALIENYLTSGGNSSFEGTVNLNSITNSNGNTFFNGAAIFKGIGNIYGGQLVIENGTDFIIRNDNQNLYFLSTNYNTTNTGYNNYRPFIYNFQNGAVTLDSTDRGLYIGQNAYYLNGCLHLNASGEFGSLGQTGYLAYTGTTILSSVNTNFSLKTPSAIQAFSFCGSSDIRIKSNVQLLTTQEASDFIDDVDIYSFEKKNTGWGVGVIAQQMIQKGYSKFVSSSYYPELELEELVHDNGDISAKDTLFSVDYINMIGYLIVHNKYLKSELNSLKERLQVLENGKS